MNQNSAYYAKILKDIWRIMRSNDYKISYYHFLRRTKKLKARTSSEKPYT